MSKPAVAPEPATKASVIPEQRAGHLARIFRAFSYRDFRLLWLGAFLSSSGTWLQEAALNWILYQLTSQPRYLGFNTFFAMAPILLLTLLGGVIADRIDRRRILLASQWTQLACALLLAGLAWRGVPVMVLVYSALTLSFVSGCAQAFGGPAYQALVPMLIEKKDLPNAIALNSIQFHLARVVGPWIGSIPFAVFSEQLIAAAVSFGINGLSFIAVILALMSLRLDSIPRPANGRIRSELREGLAFVWHQEGLRSLTLLSFASTFLGMQMTTFFPIFAKDIFRTGVQGNLMLIGISGAGAVVGALIVAALGHIHNKGRWALIMQICFGITLVLFAMTTTLWAAYVIIFVASIFMMCVFSLIASLVQLIVSDQMRGRVMSIYMVAFRGGAPLGALLTGLLAEYFPLPRVILAEGALLAILGAAYLLSPSQVKEH
jgi:MFS family permease